MDKLLEHVFIPFESLNLRYIEDAGPKANQPGVAFDDPYTGKRIDFTGAELQQMMDLFNRERPDVLHD